MLSYKGLVQEFGNSRQDSTQSGNKNYTIEDLIDKAYLLEDDFEDEMNKDLNDTKKN